jgi:hypothetical protein
MDEELSEITFTEKSASEMEEDYDLSGLRRESMKEPASLEEQSVSMSSMNSSLPSLKLVWYQP